MSKKQSNPPPMGMRPPAPPGPPSIKNARITLFLCGPSQCKHEWDGDAVEVPDGLSAKCVKCGALAIDEAHWL